MKGEVKWFAIYTKPRWEKKIAKQLDDIGIIVYCPLNKVLRQWSDRKKLVLEPLFKGYVFVQIVEEDSRLVKQVSGVVNFVYRNGKPAIVRQEEIEIIQRFLDEFSAIEIEDVGLEPNKQVVIRNGILVNYRGIVLEVLGNRAKVLIESMGLKLSATINTKNLQVV
ncbi:MAG TPA: UpxY family transcription antiterminator [Flavisolibacter sp.]|jgi:transcription antitermination factor NusG|nr:UpxY family transcription antiterminator [Flavisolibacter sp.]